MNPWGITDAEAAYMDALCEIGSRKAAARAIGITETAGRERLRHVCLRMAGLSPHARKKLGSTAGRGVHTICACIAWAQWVAANNEQRREAA